MTKSLNTELSSIGDKLSPAEPERMTDEEVRAIANKMREYRTKEAELGEFEVAHPDPRFKYHFETAGLKSDPDAVEKLLAKGWVKATDYEVGGKHGLKKARFSAKHANHDFQVLKAPVEVIEEDHAQQRILAERKLAAVTANTHGTFNNTLQTGQSAINAGMLFGK